MMKKIHCCSEENCNNVISGFDGRCQPCAGKLIWNDKEFREKTLKSILKSQKVSPNKPEKKLNDILQKLFPDEYKLNVKVEIIIAGKIPDFINCNGQKKLIELFGTYWHADPTEYREKDISYRGLVAKDIWKKDRKRIKTFKKYGYKTLIIWEHELDNIVILNKKLVKFNNFREI